MTEKKKKSPLIIRADLWLIGGVLLAALLLWLCLSFLIPRGAEAVVTVQGREVVRLPLGTDTGYRLETEYGTHFIRVSDGAVSVEAAPCPDKICVHHAPVSQSGETIICLPCSVVVTVVGAGDDVMLPEEEAAP